MDQPDDRDVADADRPATRFYGRRRGRTLRRGQQALIAEALPRHRLTLDDLPSFIAGRMGARPLWLELGFGAGEHAAFQAAANPTIDYLACDLFETGIATLLGHVGRAGLGNLRILVEDARQVLEVLAPGSVARAFVLFPDPWPKARHHKRRLIGPATMARLADILTDGAELRLATDDADYLRVTLAVACDHPAFDWQARRPSDWRERPPDWPETRYEAKARAAGRRPAFLRLIRRPRPTEEQ